MMWILSVSALLAALFSQGVLLYWREADQDDA